MLLAKFSTTNVEDAVLPIDVDFAKTLFAVVCLKSRVVESLCQCFRKMSSPLLLRAALGGASLLASRGKDAVPAAAVSALNALVVPTASAPSRGPVLNSFRQDDGAANTGSSRVNSLLASGTIGVKANLCVEGRPATAASAALQSYVAPYTATAVERAQSAGSCVAAMTNMDEFGMGSASAYSVHGAARNPASAPFALIKGLLEHSSTKSSEVQGSQGTSSAATEAQLASMFEHAFSKAWLTPGGSSGGSAAAVAAGAVEAAFGSDTGGSVRQPAAFCGVVGLKPSYGRLSRWGLIAYASSLDTVGLLTQSTGDAALLLDLCAGHDARDDTSLRLPRTPLAQCSAEPSAASEAAVALARDLMRAAADAAATAGVPVSLALSAGYCAGRGAIMQSLAEFAAASASSSTAAGAARAPPFAKLAAVDRVHSAVSAALLGRGNAAGSAAGLQSLAGLRVGIPSEYFVEELPEAGRGTVAAAAALLARCGATIVPVSLPSTAAALSAYYLLASCEALSNLARYDGVRYGYRAPDHEAAASAEGAAGIDSAAAIAAAANASGPAGGASSGSGSSSSGTSGSTNAAQRLHELYKRTRTAAFGREVQRRLMIGNFALSRGARAAYYEAARRVRTAVTLDFDAVFRPLRPLEPAGSGNYPQVASPFDGRELHLLTSASEQPLNRYLAAQSALGSAAAELGVDILLTPTSPSPPWLSHETASQRAVDMYMNDIMTVPASLARLPALAVPVGGQAYPEAALDAYRAGVSKFCVSDAAAALGRQHVEALAARVESEARVPASVQLIGRFADESTLLRVGSALETAVAMARS